MQKGSCVCEANGRMLKAVDDTFGYTQYNFTGTKRQVFLVLIIYKLYKYVKELGFNLTRGR